MLTLNLTNAALDFLDALPAKQFLIVPTLRVGMRLRTLHRPRFNLCFMMLCFNNEDAGASTAAFQRGALER